MTVKDLTFVRDKIMEVYRTNLRFGEYNMMISLSKTSSVYSDGTYAITVTTNTDNNWKFHNLPDINPGHGVYQDLSENTVNESIKNMIKLTGKQPNEIKVA